MKLSMANARRRLALLWFIGAALVFVLVIAASIHRDDRVVISLWSWFLPSIVPTLSLIVGVLVSELGNDRSDGRRADAFLLMLSTWLSIAYLLLVALSLLFHLIEWITLASSQLYLAPVQGLTATALSAFFVKRDAGDPAPAAADRGD